MLESAFKSFGRAFNRPERNKFFGIVLVAAGDKIPDAGKHFISFCGYKYSMS